jgi:proteasome alpha subunit
VLGGQAEQITEALSSDYQAGADLQTNLRLGARLLGADEPLTAEQLEVALLDRTRPRRAFRRIARDELANLLGS